MRRREFIALVGGAAAAWPRTARGQRRLPVIGILHSASPGPFYVDKLTAFFRGLSDMEFIEGQNVNVDYRWAETQYERLPSLANELVRRQVDVIVAIPTPAALAAKAATTAIPIVFLTAGDPIKMGFVASLNRPGGNLTGLTVLVADLAAKQIELLHELLPSAPTLGLLVNPSNPTIAQATTYEAQMAASALGLQLLVVNASTERELDGAFATLRRERAAALMVAGDAFFNSKVNEFVALEVRYALPTIHVREFVAAGGLMSYEGDLTNAYRQLGNYAGRILKGAKPADLPVQQITKVELAINLKTAKALGLAIPLPLLGRADEVIE
jgi:putative ABC transport system substrate-binding protein